MSLCPSLSLSLSLCHKSPSVSVPVSLAPDLSGWLSPWLSVFSPVSVARTHTGHKRKPRRWAGPAPGQGPARPAPRPAPRPARAPASRAGPPSWGATGGAGRATTQKGQARAPSCRNSQRRIPARGCPLPLTKYGAERRPGAAGAGEGALPPVAATAPRGDSPQAHAGSSYSRLPEGLGRGSEAVERPLPSSVPSVYNSSPGNQIRWGGGGCINTPFAGEKTEVLEVCRDLPRLSLGLEPTVARIHFQRDFKGKCLSGVNWLRS